MRYSYRYLFLAGAIIAIASTFYIFRPQQKTLPLTTSAQAIQVAAPGNPNFLSPISLPTPDSASESQPEQQPISPYSAPTPQPKITLQPQAVVKPKQIIPASSPTCPGSFIEQFTCLLNRYRAERGRSKLSYDSDLAKVALGHSSWMHTTGIFSHTGLNGSRLGGRCSAAGIVCRAENLAKGAASAQNLLDLWKASPTHNANLLGNYTTIGLGVSSNYVTALFN